MNNANDVSRNTARMLLNLALSQAMRQPAEARRTLERAMVYARRHPDVTYRISEVLGLL